MGVVKYTGPVASFHCPTEATIGSLKVHFSPKQLGSGTPSPENVREIVGWDGVEVNHNNSLYCDGDYPYIEVPDGLNIGDKIVAYVKQPKGITGEHGFMGVQGAIGNAFELYYLGSELKVWPSDMTLINTEYGDIDIITCKATVAKTKPYKIGVYRTDKYKYIGYIYRVTIYNSAEERIRDFIPYKQNDVIGFYDNVKKEFFTPASTSKFKNYTGEIINYEFGVLGKNKFDKSAVTDYCRINGSGEITAQSGMSISSYIPVIPRQQYTITTTGDISGNKRHAYYDQNKQYLRVLPGNPTTITIPENARYIRLTLYNDALDTTQLELGSTATTYEPYDPKHTVYGGWVDLISGEVQQKWTEPLTLGEPYYYGGNVCFGYSYPSKYTPYSDNLRANRIYSTFNKSNFDINTKNSFIFGGNSTFAKTDGNGNLNPEWTNWYNSLDVKPTISLELYEPITYHLAPTQLQTFLSQNNIWSNADYVEVEYDLYETQNILARKQFIIANQPHIESTSGNFETDMAAPLKECKVGFEPVQEGTGDPSPENVRPISGWTGLSLYHSGENLYIPNPDNKGYINVRGEIKVDTTSTYTDLIPVTAGETYSFKCTTVSVPKGTTNRRLHGYDSNGNWVMQITNRTTAAATVEDVSIVVTIPSGVSYIRASFRNQDTNVRVAKENAVSVNWETEAGTIYGGYVDLITGELVQEYATFHAKDKHWYNYSSFVIFYINKSDRTADSRDISDKLMPYTGYDWNKAPDNSIISDNSTSMFIKHPGVTSDNEFNAWLAEADPVICYKLAEPIHYSINPQTLKTLRGTNNIWSNAGDITLSYWKH